MTTAVVVCRRCSLPSQGMVAKARVDAEQLRVSQNALSTRLQTRASAGSLQLSETSAVPTPTPQVPRTNPNILRLEALERAQEQASELQARDMMPGVSTVVSVVMISFVVSSFWGMT